MIAEMTQMVLLEDKYEAMVNLMAAMWAMLPDVELDDLNLKAAMDLMLKPQANNFLINLTPQSLPRKSTPKYSLCREITTFWQPT